MHDLSAMRHAQERAELQAQLEAMQAEIDRLREEVTDLWHRSSSEKPLEDHLGMSSADHGNWVTGASLSDQGKG